MSDEFLHRLRVQPRPQFASALKARLDLQAAPERTARVKWPYIVGAFLACAGAAAYFSKSWEHPADNPVVSAPVPPQAPPARQTPVVTPVASVKSPAPSVQKPAGVPARRWADVLADAVKDQPKPASGEAAALPLSAEPMLQTDAAPPAWLLTCGGDDSVVLRFTAAGTEEILRAERITTYGTSAAGAIAFITRPRAGGTATLLIVDVHTRKVSRSLSIPDQPVEWMNGPHQGVVLTDRFAYYISLRYASNEVVTNEKGGIGTLQRIDLASGEAHAFPLPGQTLRLFDFGGVPLIYSGYDVWKLDEKTGDLKSLATRADMPDVVRWKNAAQQERRALGYPDFVAIEGAGVFRLSQVGALQHLLDADLKLIAAPRPSVHAGAPQALRGIFPGILDGRPVIGVVEEGKAQATLTYRDPLTLRSAWSVVLPPGAELYSIYSAKGNAVYYVDQEAAFLNRVAGERVQPVWKLTAEMAARRCQPKVLRVEYNK